MTAQRGQTMDEIAKEGRERDRQIAHLAKWMFNQDGADMDLTWENAFSYERDSYTRRAKNMLSTLRDAGFRVTGGAS